MTTSVQVPSDSEDDEDYVPPQDDSDSSSDERQVKKPKLGSNEPEDTPELDTATRDALWAEFQSSVGQKSQGTATQETKEQVKRMVTFQVAYKFAGETSV
ncbi:hypothetical protein FRC03_001347 [Tulasnella sp. 419]|nr:hypothetical protein FRC03_001347 [Tulasnella sp. 419]